LERRSEMKISMDAWMEGFLQAVTGEFGPRVEFVGLQGSRGRGENGENSDIDVVVILDRMTPQDLERYRRAVAGLPSRELLCGFVSGREELKHWDRGDLFQLYFDTTPYWGGLDFLAPPGREEAAQAARLGACNLYHICAHNFLHGRRAGTLSELYKTAVFVLQAKHYRDTGAFLRHRSQLLEALEGEDRRILERAMELKGGRTPDIDGDSQLLFRWAGEQIRGEC